jgi:hypothetical protein
MLAGEIGKVGSVLMQAGALLMVIVGFRVYALNVAGTK